MHSFNIMRSIFVLVVANMVKADIPESTVSGAPAPRVIMDSAQYIGPGTVVAVDVLLEFHDNASEECTSIENTSLVMDEAVYGRCYYAAGEYFTFGGCTSGELTAGFQCDELCHTCKYNATVTSDECSSNLNKQYSMSFECAAPACSDMPEEWAGDHYPTKGLDCEQAFSCSDSSSICDDEISFDDGTVASLGDFCPSSCGRCPAPVSPWVSGGPSGGAGTDIWLQVYAPGVDCSNSRKRVQVDLNGLTSRICYPAPEYPDFPVDECPGGPNEGNPSETTASYFKVDSCTEESIYLSLGCDSECISCERTGVEISEETCFDLDPTLNIKASILFSPDKRILEAQGALSLSTEETAFEFCRNDANLDGISAALLAVGHSNYSSAQVSIDGCHSADATEERRLQASAESEVVIEYTLQAADEDQPFSPDIVEALQDISAANLSGLLSQESVDATVINAQYFDVSNVPHALGSGFRADCPMFPVLSNVAENPDCKDSENEDRCELSCEAGFVSKNDSDIYALCTNGAWIVYGSCLRKGASGVSKWVSQSIFELMFDSTVPELDGNDINALSTALGKAVAAIGDLSVERVRVDISVPEDLVAAAATTTYLPSPSPTPSPTPTITSGATTTMTDFSGSGDSSDDPCAELRAFYDRMNESETSPPPGLPSIPGGQYLDAETMTWDVPSGQTTPFPISCFESVDPCWGLAAYLNSFGSPDSIPYDFSSGSWQLEGATPFPSFCMDNVMMPDTTSYPGGGPSFFPGGSTTSSFDQPLKRRLALDSLTEESSVDLDARRLVDELVMRTEITIELPEYESELADTPEADRADLEGELAQSIERRLTGGKLHIETAKFLGEEYANLWLSMRIDSVGPTVLIPSYTWTTIEWLAGDLGECDCESADATRSQEYVCSVKQWTLCTGLTKPAGSSEECDCGWDVMCPWGASRIEAEDTGVDCGVQFGISIVLTVIFGSCILVFLILCIWAIIRTPFISSGGLTVKTDEGTVKTKYQMGKSSEESQSGKRVVKWRMNDADAKTLFPASGTLTSPTTEDMKDLFDGKTGDVEAPTTATSKTNNEIDTGNMSPKAKTWLDSKVSAYLDDEVVEYFSSSLGLWRPGYITRAVKSQGAIDLHARVQYDVHLPFSGQTRHDAGLYDVRPAFSMGEKLQVYFVGNGNADGAWKDAEVAEEPTQSSTTYGYMVQIYDNGNEKPSKIMATRLRRRFDVGEAVQVYLGIDLGWSTGIVKDLAPSKNMERGDHSVIAGPEDSSVLLEAERWSKGKEVTKGMVPWTLVGIVLTQESGGDGPVKAFPTYLVKRPRSPNTNRSGNLTGKLDNIASAAGGAAAGAIAGVVTAFGGSPGTSPVSKEKDARGKS